jgi:hypothetical protein
MATKVNPYKTTQVWNYNGRAAKSYATLSKDGKTQTFHMSGTDKEGKPFTELVVFEKQWKERLVLRGGAGLYSFPAALRSRCICNRKKKYTGTPIRTIKTPGIVVAGRYTNRITRITLAQTI